VRAESSAAADDQPHSIEELATCQGHVSPMGAARSLSRSDHCARFCITRGSFIRNSVPHSTTVMLGAVKPLRGNEARAPGRRLRQSL
jgi:hypothetical protein